MSSLIWPILFLGGFGIVTGIGLFVAIGFCSRCGVWSMSYTCSGCNRGRYDYTP
jgi:hypothetical protein